MKILVVSQYFWPENFRINDLVSELIAKGHRVTVLTGLPNYPDGQVFEEYKSDPSAFKLYQSAEVVRVPLVPRGSGSLRLLLNYVSFVISACTLGVWKLRGKDFDVIFTCQLSPVTVGLPAMLLRWLKNAPMIFWVLDLWPESLKAVGVVSSDRILKWVGKLTGYIYNRSDLILIQSKSFKFHIKKYAADDRRIEYFPSWAEDIFSSTNVSPAEEVQIKQNSFNVMFAGNIGDAQDFPAILAAAEILKSSGKIRWLVLGDGRAASWLNKEVARRGLSNVVCLLGRYPLERMPSFFKHADALLVSLKDEPIFSMTIPGKMQSYLAAGIPVLAMLNGEGADVIHRSGAGLACKAGDSVGLAEAVLKLSNMKSEELAEMGRLGKRFGDQEFGRQTLMSKLEGWMKELSTAEFERRGVN